MSAFRHALSRVLPIMLLCMMVSALAPHGFMPGAGRGGFQLVLCSSVLDAGARVADADDPAAAAMLAALKQAQKQQHGADGSDSPPACPFAGVALGELPLLAALPAPLAQPARPVPFPPGQVILARHHAARPPATGPPHLI